MRKTKGWGGGLKLFSQKENKKNLRYFLTVPYIDGEKYVPEKKKTMFARKYIIFGVTDSQLLHISTISSYSEWLLTISTFVLCI